MSLIANNGAYLKKKIPETPIMSFQTNHNGTFAPVITPSSGTLKWVVDGVEQVTNTPSYTLTGSTVDVEVYANDVIAGEEVTSVSMDNLGLIGQLSFEWFRLNCAFATRLNAGVTSVTFSTYSNVITNLFRINSCNITGVVDCSNVQFVSSSIEVYSNPLLTGVTISTSANTVNSVNISNTAITSFSFTNIQILSGLFNADNCNSLATINMGLNSHTLSNGIRISNTLISTIDLSNTSISGQYRITGNSNLTSITHSTTNGTLTVATANNNNLSAWDMSGFIITGAIFFYGNTNLTVFTQPKVGSSTTLLRGYSCNLNGNVDLSNITASATVDLNNNPNLTSITAPIYTTSFTNYNLSGCGLNPTGVDNVYTTLNTFFSANAPTINLTVNTSGGTNASPSATGLAAINNLDTSVYPGAGYDFIYSIN